MVCLNQAFQENEVVDCPHAGRLCGGLIVTFVWLNSDLSYQFIIRGMNFYDGSSGPVQAEKVLFSNQYHVAHFGISLRLSLFLSVGADGIHILLPVLPELLG